VIWWGKCGRIRTFGRKKRGWEDSIIMEIKYYMRPWTVFNYRRVGKMAGYFEGGNVFVGPAVTCLIVLYLKS
jgi:hypothetical protein